jgi:hypothetical protein
MVARLLGRVCRLLSDGMRLPAVPKAIESIAQSGDASIDDYLELDDNTLWTAMGVWRKANDPVVRDFAERLYARRLFKTYELYGDAREPATAERMHQTAREIARARGLDPDQYIGLDVASDVPFDDTSDQLRVVFPRGPSKKPSEVSLLLGRLRGERLERVRLIFPPELREELAPAFEQ